MTILITRFSAIGDVAMTLPVVYSAARRHPGVKFVMVTRPAMATMFLNRPDNLEVCGLDVHSPRYKGVAGLRRMWRDLRRSYAPDAVADLHGSLRTLGIGLWARLAGVPVARIDKSRGRRHALTRERDKVLLPLPPQSDRYAQVFQDLGLPVQVDFRSLFPQEGAPAEAHASIADPKRPEERWVGIAPFAKHQGKIYPPRLMEQVVAAVSKSGARVFLFGGGDMEARLLGLWARKYPRVTSLAGQRHGFPAELALMSHLDVMVSMDSANMHLASLAGTPVVSVWGATHPYCGFSPHGQSEADMVQLPMPCRPCSIYGNKPCRRSDYHCLAGIKPQAIVDKVMARIAPPQGSQNS